MNRHDKMDWLIQKFMDDDANTGGELFASLLRSGHKGFETMTNAELDAEMEENGYEKEDEE